MVVLSADKMAHSVVAQSAESWDYLKAVSTAELMVGRLVGMSAHSVVAV